MLEDAFTGAGVVNIEKPELKECYIAYFDILGYKSQVAKDPQGTLDRVYNGFNFAKNRVGIFNGLLTSIFGNTSEVKRRVFSDNIVMAVSTEEATSQKIIFFLEQVRELQIQFMHQGFFVRGAVVKGDIAISDEFVFGEGLVRAVEMEEANRHPKIIIDKVVWDDIPKKPIRPHDEKLLKYLEFISTKKLSELAAEDPEEVVKAIKILPPIINSIFLDAAIYLPPLTGAEQARQDFVDAAIKYAENKEPTTDDLVNIYLMIQQYAGTALQMEERILAVKDADMIQLFQELVKSLVYMDADKVYCINYLWLFDPKSGLAVDSQEVIKKAEKEFGEKSIVADETKKLHSGFREQFLQENLVAHRKLVIELIEIACTLKGIDQSKLEDEAVKEKIDRRLSLQAKARWAKEYHNFVARENGFENLVITCKGKPNKKTSICIKPKGTSFEIKEN